MKKLWTALLVPTIVVTIMLVPLQADEIANWKAIVAANNIKVN